MKYDKTPEEMDATALLEAFGDRNDRESLRFQAFCADRLLHLLRPSPGERFLDVAAGNGILAVAAAQAVQPGGRITAIDRAEHLLAGLDSKIRQFGFDNIDVHCMDGAHTDFRREYFHNVVCSLEMHRFPDLLLALQEWHRVLRPGGRLACASLRTPAFRPQVDMLRHLLARAGHPVEIPWQQTGEYRMLESALTESGFSEVKLHEAQLGYHLATPDQWWEVIEHSPLRSWLRPLSSTERRRLRAEHLAEVNALVGDEGLWLDVPVLLVLSRKH